MRVSNNHASKMRASCFVRSSLDSPHAPDPMTRSTFLVRGISSPDPTTPGGAPLVQLPKHLSDDSVNTASTTATTGLISNNHSVGPQFHQQQSQQSLNSLTDGSTAKRLSLDSRTSLDSFSRPDYGLLITLRKNENNNDGGCRCELSFTQDEHYTEIHPNAYAPANLNRMHKLGGGGSGVSVFEGQHPILGDVVMKHGGDKDLKELFALATIAEELKARGTQQQQQQNNKNIDNNNTTTAAATAVENETTAAAKDLQSRIPEFRMIYISPHHLGEKRRELWYRLSHMYKYSSRNLLVLPEQEEMMEQNSLSCLQEEEEEEGEGEEGGEKKEGEVFEKASPLKTRRANRRAMMQQHNNTPSLPPRNGLNMTQSGTVHGHRDIAIYATSDGKCGIELLGDSLTVTIPVPDCNDKQQQPWGDGWNEPIVVPGDGYKALQAFATDLNKLMKEHKWKFTLGQKRIGGNNPQTGNLWLYGGKLEGKLLDNLISQNIQLVRGLVTLTTEEERSPKHLRAVQEEMVLFEEEEDITPGDISSLSDSFVGNAIKKNFQEGSGRMPVLSALGKQFREFSQHHHHFKRLSSSSDNTWSSDHSERDSYGNFVSTDPDEQQQQQQQDDLVLTPEEEVPAHHLGVLTRAGALMGDTFHKVPLEPTVLEMNRFFWRTVLRAAIQPRRDGTANHHTMAMTRLWTCGLTDAGVHNLFLSENSFWLFDLGQPQLYSVPGFLTKFLFSFFHTLGMEETDDGGWVRRFEHNPLTNRLVSTPETDNLLAKAYDAFEITLNRLIDELFDGDHSLRWLLIQYVTLQLISDASFCLQRWTIKGGGRTRDANHQTGIEKWLWRAIWDIYVAFDLNSNETRTRLYVEHPSDRDSMFYEDMRDMIGISRNAQSNGAMNHLDDEHKESKEEE